VDGSHYAGIMRIEELQDVLQEQWSTSRVVDHMRTDFPTVPVEAIVRDALVAMEAADADVLAVVDGDSFVGVVTTTEILRLNEILDRADDTIRRPTDEAD
jgi:CBS domain-containing protein